VLIVEREQIPGDERGRRLLGEHAHARLRRMDAQQERLELQASVSGDDDLAVEDRALRQRRPDRRLELREVSVERLQIPGLDIRLIAVAEDDGPEAVTLRLEQPAVTLRQRVGRLGEHGFDGWLERELHALTVPGNARLMLGGARWPRNPRR